MSLFNRLLILVLLVTFRDGLAQVKQLLNAPSKSSPTSTQTFVGVNKFYNSELDYPIEGSPYADDQFVKGSIYHYRGVQRDIDMRLNVYYNQIEYKVKDSVWVVSADKLIRKVVMDDQTLIVNLYEVKGKQSLAFFFRLDSGKATLLIKKNIGYREPQFGKAIEGNVPAKYYKLPDEHFFKIGDGPLLKIQSMKKFIEDLPDHKSEMEQFAKKEKISVNKPKELTRFIQYYNSL